MTSPQLDPLGAFYNKPSTKQLYLDRMRAHRLAGQIVQDKYWWDQSSFTGCAIGCLTHSSHLEALQSALNIPKALGKLAGLLHSFMDKNRSIFWGEELLNAMTTGGDISGVIDGFILWTLTNNDALRRYAVHEDLDLIEHVLELFRQRIKGHEPLLIRWKDAHVLADNIFSLSLRRNKRSTGTGKIVSMTPVDHRRSAIILACKQAVLSANDQTCIWDFTHYLHRLILTDLMADTLLNLLKQRLRRYPNIFRPPSSNTLWRSSRP